MTDLVRGSASFVRPPEGCVVAIGNFDGVHLGHQAVLAQVRERAQALGARAVVYTFEPAPTAIVAPTRHQPRISTLHTRATRLFAAGAEVVVVEPFDQAFSGIDAQRFAAEIVRDRLGARVVTVGHDFRFGRGREGDAEKLATWLPGVDVRVLEAVTEQGAPISSSRIRKLIAAGEVAAAARLLGRPSVLTGPVVHGDARGRTIGVPTANVAVREELLPGFGVYAVRLRRGADRWDGVANIGMRPTFSGTRPSVEVHLFDVDVDLHAFVREERRFDGIASLVTQIGVDIGRARELLA
jgi:riboflavin kinase / FMN adenylyltransferase